MTNSKCLFSIGLLFFCFVGWSQDDFKVVQFSGRTLGEDATELIYTNIAVKGTSRGTVSDIDGFFSLPVRENETIQFSRIGYELLEFQVPTDIEGDLFSRDILLKKDTLFLPEALILPWPDKDFFEIEFLALEVENYLEDIANENLADEKIAILRQVLPVDGTEVSKIELQQAARAYYSAGQFKPQNIFNPLSWKKFIDAIRRGDFKKKN